MSANYKRGFFVLAVGIVIMLFSFLFPGRSENGIENNQLTREEYGQGDRQVSLTAISDYGETVIDYTVSERKYTEAEIKEILPEFLEKLEQIVNTEENMQSGEQRVVNFVSEVEGYPFYISWSSDRSDLIGSQGNIKEEIREDTVVIVSAELEYEDWVYEHSFPIILTPNKYTGEEEWIRSLENALAEADAESKQQQYIGLPSVVNKTSVKWKEERNRKGTGIGGLCIAVAVIFFFSDSVEKREEKKRRMEKIRKEYPEFVLKCAMLIGAGMTIRQTFQRLGQVYLDGRGKKNPIYEELLIGIRELENGIPERQVYENFGRRCGIRETEKLGNMLSGNLRKGFDGLKSALREEAKEALDMQKEHIRKKGEIAGTKLLFPMLILLLIVMVIIMIPAFSTFSI